MMKLRVGCQLKLKYVQLQEQCFKREEEKAGVCAQSLTSTLPLLLSNGCGVCMYTDTCE